MRVSLFATCLGDALFPEVLKATVVLLRKLGCEVLFPEGQVCCGQMHVNTGYPEEALSLVRRHVETFSSFEVIISPSGSCVASVRHQQAEVARALGDEALAERAEELAQRTYELSEFLIDVLGVENVGAEFRHRVTYHPTCHSLRALKVGDRPRRLLANVAGIELVDLPDAEACCGFGGTFSLKNPDVSTAMLADKLAAIINTKAEVVTAADVSCLMHIGGGMSRLNTGVRAMHLVEILASTRTGE